MAGDVVPGDELEKAEHRVGVPQIRNHDRGDDHEDHNQGEGLHRRSWTVSGAPIAPPSSVRLRLVELALEIVQLGLNRGPSVLNSLVVDGRTEMADEEVDEPPGVELAEVAVELLPEQALNLRNETVAPLGSEPDPHRLVAFGLRHHLNSAYSTRSRSPGFHVLS